MPNLQRYVSGAALITLGLAFLLFQNCGSSLKSQKASHKAGSEDFGAFDNGHHPPTPTPSGNHGKEPKHHRNRIHTHQHPRTNNSSAPVLIVDVITVGERGMAEGIVVLCLDPATEHMSPISRVKVSSSEDMCSFRNAGGTKFGETRPPDDPQTYDYEDIFDGDVGSYFEAIVSMSLVGPCTVDIHCEDANGLTSETYTIRLPNRDDPHE